MYAGLDFGTSNCSIGVWRENEPKLLPLEGKSKLLPSALYTSRKDIQVEELDQVELERRVSNAKRKQSTEVKRALKKNQSIREFSDSELENIERGIMRREIAERENRQRDKQTIAEAVYSDAEIVFGEEAILRHIEDPLDGYFIKSPKSFLGSDISNYHLDFYAEIITRMIAFIKQKAEATTKSDIQSIVIGRPVNFHGTRGELGNTQAIGIMERAAIAAGYKNVEFLMEPIAAALDFERQLSLDVVVLVLDAGGGTTDCSMVKLGPSHIESIDRSESILGFSGDRVGGYDFDIKLAQQKIMPYFGRNSLLENGLPIPSPLFSQAIAFKDVNAHAEFVSMKTGRKIASYLDQAIEKEKVFRLQKLHEGKLSFRLNRSSELAKIQLTDSESINLPLEYIESDFVIPISRNDLKESIQRELDVFMSLMKEVEKQAGVSPDVIYVTGGTAKSPVVKNWLQSAYKDIEIIVGDEFASVSSGLTTWAHRLYK